MFRIFDPIIREIDRLVAEQISNIKIERLQAVPSNTNGVKVSISPLRTLWRQLLKPCRRCSLSADLEAVGT
jgi:hypothetical protein